MVTPLRMIGLRAALLLMVGAICFGCSLFDPYVDVPSNDRTARTDPTLANAVAYGEALRRGYLGAISQHATVNSITGVVLIPLTAAAAGLGATGGQPNLILGLGLGGASLYAGTNFLYSKPRQLVYAAGANAISCSIAAMGPLRMADRVTPKGSTLNASLARLATAAVKLETVIKASSGIVPRTRTEAANQLLTQAHTALTLGRQGQTALAEAGTTLLGSIDQIQDLVTKYLIQTEPDLGALVNSLSSAIPMYAGKLVPAVATRLGSPPIAKAADRFLAQDLGRELNTDMAEAAAATEEVAAVVQLVAAGPSQDVMKACIGGVGTAVATLSVVPDSVTVAHSSARQTVAIVVSGGLGTYRADFVGPQATDITISRDYQNPTTAVIKLDIGPNAPALSQLLIAEAGGLQKIVTVTVRDGAATPPVVQAGGTGGAGGGVTTGDQDVKTVQTQLGALYTGPTDGVAGPATRAAVSKYLASGRPDIPTDKEIDQLLTSNIGMLIKWLTGVKAPADWRKQLTATTPAPSGMPGTTVPAKEDKANKEILPVLRERECTTQSDAGTSIEIREAVDAAFAALRAKYPELQPKKWDDIRDAIVSDKKYICKSS